MNGFAFPPNGRPQSSIDIQRASGAIYPGYVWPDAELDGRIVPDLGAAGVGARVG